MSDPLLPASCHVPDPAYVTGSEGVLPPPPPLEPMFDWLPGEPCDPWYQELFPPRRASGFVRWKLMSTALNHTRRLWALREERVAAHSALHGPDPAGWPRPHVGIVLRVPEVSYGACLGCLWLEHSDLDERGLRAALSEHEADPEASPPTIS